MVGALAEPMPIRAVRVECWRLRLEPGTRNATEGEERNATEGVPYSAATLHGELIREANAEAAP